MSKKLDSPMASTPPMKHPSGNVVNHGVYAEHGLNRPADYSTVDVTFGVGDLNAKMAPLNSPMTKNIVTGKK